MLVDEELTKIIKGCFYEVQNEVGLGLPEEAYQKGMIESLQARQIPFASKPMLTIRHGGHVVMEMFPDFIVAERVIVELKTLRDSRIMCLPMALKDGLSSFDKARACSYLANLKVRFGVVANFGKNALELHGVASPSNADGAHG